MPFPKEFPVTLDITDHQRLFQYVYEPAGFGKAHSSRASIVVLNVLHNRIFSNDTNCQSFVHLVYQHCFKLVVPDWMLSYEIFTDKGDFFRDVDWRDGEKLQLGDILFFKRSPREANVEFNSDDPKNYHMAVATGRFYQDGSPELIHANWVDGKVSLWPYWQFFQLLDHDNNGKYKIWYTECVGVKRWTRDEEIFTQNFGSYCMYSRKDHDPFIPVAAKPEWFPKTAVIFPNARN